MNDAAQRLVLEIEKSGMTRKEWYRKAYLFSHHWEVLRMAAKFFYGEKCAKCGKEGFLDVHHLNYRNIFDVGIPDLQILCRKCHKLEHADVPAKKKAKKKKRSKKAMMTPDFLFADYTELPRDTPSATLKAFTDRMKANEKALAQDEG